MSEDVFDMAGWRRRVGEGVDGVGDGVDGVGEGVDSMEGGPRRGPRTSSTSWGKASTRSTDLVEQIGDGVHEMEG